MLFAEVYPSNASDSSLNWNSSNPDVATTLCGLVFSKGIGTTTITASANDGSGVRACCKVTVVPGIPVSLVKFERANLIMNVGDTAKIKYKILPENATQKSLLWQSDDPTIATVDITGAICGVKEGVTIIHATSKDQTNQSDHCTIRVCNPLVKSIEIEPTKTTLAPGEKTTLIAKISPPNATNRDFRWHSDFPRVATIDPISGEVTAISEGTARITAELTEGILKGACEITVDPREKVTIKQDEDSFYIQFSSIFGSLVWKYIGYSIPNTEKLIPQSAISRNYENALEEFSEKQLAFLYLFDPLGVENYVKEYNINRTKENRKKTKEFLSFKDQIYKEIFGRMPHLFMIFPDGTKQYFLYNERINRLNFYSEAEILFGSHTINSSFAIAATAFETICGLISIVPGVDTLCMGMDFIRSFFYSNAFSDVVESSFSALTNEYIQCTGDKAWQEKWGKKLLKQFNWTNTLMTVLTALGTGFVKHFTPCDLTDIAIYEAVDKKAFHTYFLVDNCEIPMSTILHQYIG